MKKVLLIDDDREIATIIAQVFSLELPCDFVAAHTAEAGMQHALSDGADLIILDLTLPDMSGLDVCKELRLKGLQTPILCLTSRADAIDKIVGFENGADDYVTKPFNPRELVARIKAIWRRSGELAPQSRQESGSLQLGKLTIDFNTHEILLDSQRLDFSSTEFDIVALLAQTPGHVFRRSELLSDVLGYSTEEYDHSITAHICRIRSKLETDPDRPVYIRTVRGVGYRFATEEELAAAGL